MKDILIIGAGPAGLTAAIYAGRAGMDALVIEKLFAGGQIANTHLLENYPGFPDGISGQDFAEAMRKQAEKFGAEFVSAEITKLDLSGDIKKIYAGEKCFEGKTVILAGGAIPRKLGIEGDDAKGVVSAVTLLRDIGDEEAPDFTGMDIVVVGGGNVAMDVARSAVRLGAKTVKIVYRRRRKDMPAQTIEIEGAVADGCQLLELKAPSRIETDADGNAVALWVKPQMVSEIKKGRPTVIPTKAEEERIACDQVLVAIGQDIDAIAFNEIGLPLTKKGTFEVDNTTHISYMPGVFTGGDAVTGPATVIRAIAGGKVAAANIDEYLGFNHVLPNDIEIPPIRLVDRAPWGRVDMLERPAPESIHDFNIVEYCMTEEEAHQESGRCLHCDHFGMGKLRGGRVRTW